MYFPKKKGYYSQNESKQQKLADAKVSPTTDHYSKAQVNYDDIETKH